jgi:hypothetical protein
MANVLSWRPYQEECTHCQNTDEQADNTKVQATVATAADGWDPGALSGHNIGLILQEMDNKNYDLVDNGNL